MVKSNPRSLTGPLRTRPAPSAPAPSPAPAPTPTPTPEPNPNPLSETLSSTCRSIRRAEAGGAAARPDPVAAASILAPAPPDERAAASGDPSSGPNQGGRVPNGNGDDRAALAAEKADKARKRRVRSELRRRRPSPPPSPAPAFPGLLRGSYCRGRRGRRQAAAAAVQGGGHAQARRWRAPGVHRARLPRRRRGQSATPTEAPQPHRQAQLMLL